MEHVPSRQHDDPHLEELGDVVRHREHHRAQQEVALTEALAQGAADGPVSEGEEGEFTVQGRTKYFEKQNSSRDLSF